MALVHLFPGSRQPPALDQTPQARLHLHPEPNFFLDKILFVADCFHQPTPLAHTSVSSSRSLLIRTVPQAARTHRQLLPPPAASPAQPPLQNVQSCSSLDGVNASGFRLGFDEIRRNSGTEGPAFSWGVDGGVKVMDKKARKHGYCSCTTLGYTSGEELADDKGKLMGEPDDQWETCGPVSPRLASLLSKPPEFRTAPSQESSTEHGHDRGSRKNSTTKAPVDDEACRQIHGTRRRSLFHVLQLGLMLLMFFVKPSEAAFVSFKDCLSPNVINSNPKQLQFTPLLVWASFNSSASHNLNVTVYGNVSGQATQQNPPTNPLDPSWNDPNITLGKIIDVPKNFTTLTGSFNVLDYTPYEIPATRFCNTTVHGQCPIAPVFKNMS